MAEFLESMGFVAKAFGMHLPNQQAQNKPLLKDAQVLVAKKCYIFERNGEGDTGIHWKKRLSLKVRMAVCLLRQ